MNRNSCGSYEKMIQKEKFIIEYSKFDYQRKIKIINKFRFIYIYILSK